MRTSRRESVVAARVLATCGLLLFLSCTDGSGPFVPGGSDVAELKVLVSSEGPAATPAALQPATLRATLQEPGQGGRVVADTTLSVTPDQTVDLTLTVQIGEDEEPFLLTVVLLNGDGDEIYRAGPTTVIARRPGSGGAPSQVSLSYSGPGAGAARVQIAPDPGNVRFGETIDLSVTAFSEGGGNLGEAPVDWVTLDPELVTLVDEAAGRWRGGETRGIARVIATFEPSAVADTAFIRVSAPPGSISIVSGDGQDGSAGAALDVPLVVEVRGSDGIPLEGEDVTFATQDGGSAAPETLVTDAVGRAATDWTLGPMEGTQTLTASVTNAPSIAAEFTAEVGPAGLSRVEVTPGEVAFDAASATFALTAQGFDPFDNPVAVSGFSWASSNRSVATVSPTGVVTAVGNGSAGITASAEGVTSASTTVVVDQVAVRATIEPESGWVLPLGQFLVFRAFAFDRLDQVIPGATFTWNSPEPISRDTIVVEGLALGPASVSAVLDANSSISVTSMGEVVEAPPEAPGNVTATPRFPNEGSFAGFTVAWSDLSNGATHFVVERSLDAGDSWEAADANAVASPTIDGGPPGGWPQDHEVLHRVSACRGVICSPPTVTPAPRLTPPVPPANVAAAFLANDTTLRVTWVDTNNLESGYRVRIRLLTCNSPTTGIAVGTFDTGPDSSRYDLTGVSDGAPYQIWVSSRNTTDLSSEVFTSVGDLGCETP